MTPANLEILAWEETDLVDQAHTDWLFFAS